MSVLRHGVNTSLVDVSTAAPKFDLGATYIDKIKGQYRYAQASGAIDAGAAVILALTVGSANTVTDVQATEVDTTGSGSTPKVIGIAQATLADNEYGWFWVGCGHTEALVATGISAGDALTTTATAGELGSGGDAVAGLAALDANSSGSTALRTVVASGLLRTN